MPADAPAPTAGAFSLRGALVLVCGLALASLAGAAWLREPWITLASLVLAAAGLARALGTPPPATSSPSLARMVRWAVNLTLLVLTTAASLAAAEGLVRWIYRDVTSTADFRGYFTTRWMRAQVRHNHYDYRGAEFDEGKAPGVYRVAVMGDSFTYGNGVAENQRFSNLVGDAVRDRGIEVLNFGFPGNNWPEHVRTLERRVLRLRPDFVLLQWGTNDVELDEHVAGRPIVPPIIRNRDWHEWLYRYSALYTILNAQWVRIQVQRQMGDTYDRYLTRLYGDPSSEGARLAGERMHQYIALARSRGVDVGLVMFPDVAVSLGPDYPYRFLHDRTQAICQEQQVRCVDLLPAFARVPDRHTLWVTPLDAHPSVLANRLAADAILATFGPQWTAAETARTGR